MRDLTRYRMKTVQARGSEIQRLQKTLETAGIKLSSVVSDVTGVSATAMIEALIDGERRGAVLADLAQGRLRTAGKMADLSMALAGRFTDHHALMCRLHLDRIQALGEAVAGLDATIAPLAARHARQAALLNTLPGSGDVIVVGWLGAIGPAPHQHFATAQRLASWATVCPGNYMSAKKSKGGRTGNGGNYIKPLLVQAAWAAVRVPGRLQARFHRLVRRFGGARNKGAIKRAIMAIVSGQHRPRGRFLLHTGLHPVLRQHRPRQGAGTAADPAAGHEGGDVPQPGQIRIDGARGVHHAVRVDLLGKPGQQAGDQRRITGPVEQPPLLAAVGELACDPQRIGQQLRGHHAPPPTASPVPATVSSGSPVPVSNSVPASRAAAARAPADAPFAACS